MSTSAVAQTAPATSWAPTAKVAVGSIAGAVTLIIVQIIGHHGIKLPAEVVTAVTTVVTFCHSVHDAREKVVSLAVASASFLGLKSLSLNHKGYPILAFLARVGGNPADTESGRV